MTIHRVILKVADVPDAAGIIISEEALYKLAEKFPDKLQMIGKELISKVEFDDDAHKQRMLNSIAYQLDLQVQEKKSRWCSEVLSPKCSKKTVEKTDHGFEAYTWHPQWGGYGAHAVAAFEQTVWDDHGTGCFELAVYHDGDFPTDEPVFRRHCCEASQFIRFGLDVLEAQLSHQTNTEGEPVRLGEHGVARLEDFRDRITMLLDLETSRQ